MDANADVNLKRKNGISKRLHDIKENGEYLILTLPALIYFLVFNYLPMGGIILAFKDYRFDLGILKSKWVGFDNFKFFFLSQDATRVLINTVGYNSIFIILGIIMGVAVALLLFEISKRIFIKIYQTIMILPHFLSWVIVAYIAYIFLDPNYGLLNQLLCAFKIPAVQWYAEPKLWPLILIIVQTWKTVGMGSIIYYAALMGIDESLYEAARMDGANRWKQTFYISIPELIPMMIILSILALGNIIKGDFGLFYQVPRDIDILYPVTDVIDTYVYRGLRNGDYAISAAVGLFQSVVGLVMVVGTNFIVKKISPENSLY